MTGGIPIVPLGEVLRPVSRPETADPGITYRILGAHWYAKGLYIKHIKRGSEIQADKVYRVEHGDFVYNRLFAWKGSFAIATEENHGCYVSNEFPVFTINRDRAEGKYLWRYFSRASAWDEALSLSSGGTPTSRNRLKEEKLLAMKIPLPSLDEQRRIVARIEELASKIEEARRLRRVAVEEAKAFASSLHLHMAGERFLRLDAFLMLEEIREDVRPGQEYPQVGVKGFGKGLFEKGSVNGSQTTYKAFNRLYYGAVVLSQVKGWEGALAVCYSDLSGRYVSPEYRTFRCVSELAKSEYLAVIFATPWFWTQLKNMTRGVGARRERILPEQFLRIEIPMPTVEQQAWAMPVLASLSDLGTLQAETAAELDAMLPSVLDKAFRGSL